MKVDARDVVSFGSDDRGRWWRRGDHDIGRPSGAHLSGEATGTRAESRLDPGGV